MTVEAGTVGEGTLVEQAQALAAQGQPPASPAAPPAAPEPPAAAQPAQIVPEAPPAKPAEAPEAPPVDTGGLLDEGTQGALEGGLAAEGEAPAEYSAFTLPEGMELDENILNEFLPVAQELELDQEGAQKLIDFQVKVATQRQEAIDAALTQEEASWKESFRADPNYTANTANAKRGIKILGDEGYKKIQALGIEWNPAVTELFVKLGQMTAEGTTRKGGGQPNPTITKQADGPTDKWLKEQGIR